MLALSQSMKSESSNPSFQSTGTFPAQQTTSNTKSVGKSSWIRPTLKASMTHGQRNLGPSDQHPKQSQKAQQNTTCDSIIHSHLTPRSGHQSKSSSQGGGVSGHQRMVTSAYSERDNGLGSSHSTNGSMAPFAVTHAGSDGGKPSIDHGRSATPGQYTNVKMSNEAQGFRQNLIPLAHTEDFKSAFQMNPSSGMGDGGPVRSPFSPMQHRPTKFDSQHPPSPDTTRGHKSGGSSGTRRVHVFGGPPSGLLQPRTRWYAPEPRSPMTLSQRYQNLKASKAVHSSPIQSSGRNEMSQQGSSSNTITTANGHFILNSGLQSSVGSQRRGNFQRQDLGKGARIQTRFGYVRVPLSAVNFPGHTGPDGRRTSYSTSGSMVPPAVLKRLSELDLRLARLTQTKSSTSSYVIGTRVKSPSSSKKIKPMSKFKPVNPADIGGSAAFRANKPRSPSESNKKNVVPGRQRNGFLDSAGVRSVAQHRLGNTASTKILDSSVRSSESDQREPSKLNAKHISRLSLTQITKKMLALSQSMKSESSNPSSQSTGQFPAQQTTSNTKGVGKSRWIRQTLKASMTHRQRNLGPSDQHPKQSQKAQQNTTSDSIIHSHLTPRSGHQSKSSSQGGGVSGHQRMVTSAYSERDNGLGSSHSTNGSMAPSAVTHAGSDGGKPSIDLKTVLLDPRTANVTQNTKSTSSFVAGRRVIIKEEVKL
ncbi:uncharacterized protein LOC122132076 isoform X1 [Clupea harengus]|uniref:Uncharacterized protein LOC122132076 isoform X1 n=1 Tax=Clupea harengus TaxID=7950 RepID=A0A8M1KK89_CLUHA|nr:uncharacterized protein LOC122132076 isoform X1 [Clupea harengus]XP_042562773.1 uncharacterized protein LOC122132076 isoform X1 [Clupea harengus]